MELGNLQTLLYLDLSRNQLTGKFGNKFNLENKMSPLGTELFDARSMTGLETISREI